MVLLLVGIATLLLVNTQSVSDYFKENMEISVLFKPEVTEDEAQIYQASIDSLDFIRSTEFISKVKGQQEMAQMLGEDFLSVFEASPIPVSVNVKLNADYVSSDSLKVIEKRIMQSPLVDEVVYQQSLVETLNTNLKKISLVMLVFILLLLFISCVLISNTMRLSVYDKRFSIHTMKLVGATKGFIRGPFVARSVFLGLFAGFIAILMLLGILYYLRLKFPELFGIFRLDLLLLVMAIVLVAGVLICVVSTFFVVNRLASLSKDELYY